MADKGDNMGNNRNRKSREYAFDEQESEIVSEALAEYATRKQQGKYTLEDYLALPDEQRAELIDGVIYDMAAPSYLHQAVGDRVWRFFTDYIERNHGSCFAFTSPVDVQLDCDDRTVVQPDVLIVCDPTKFRNGRVFGAPDLVVEILSKSTSFKDRGLKLVKYKKAGVREYWLIEPYRKKVLVYEFEKSDSPRIYGFGDKVPVGIFKAKIFPQCSAAEQSVRGDLLQDKEICNSGCEVDFAQIYEQIMPLYDTM
ncbi:MAG: Uma2 family endonuclease [Lachnospiraceae bacterium]|nr:Uma2 family endonuclease [Lachnospiraceae bacterium]